jgi:hypothetical protein
MAHPFAILVAIRATIVALLIHKLSLCLGIFEFCALSAMLGADAGPFLIIGIAD